MSVFRIAVLAAGLAVLPAGLARADEQVSARYDITIAGMKVGAAALNGAFSASSYEASVTVRLQGMAKLVASGVGSATATGAIAGNGLQPASYSLDLRTPDKTEQIRMGLSGNAVRALAVEPDRPAAPDTVPLGASHQSGVLDPLSGGLFLSREASSQMGQDACAKVMPVFDGRQRYDLIFAFSRKDSVKAAGYSGPALVCSARYKPIAGHRPAQAQYMADNREMEIWLVPVSNSRVFLPARIKIRTPVGLASIEPVKLELGETATASIRQ